MRGNLIRNFSNGAIMKKTLKLGTRIKVGAKGEAKECRKLNDNFTRYENESVKIEEDLMERSND